MTKAKHSRRTFLAMSAGLAGLGLGLPARAQTRAPDPDVLVSRGGAIEVDLEARFGPTRLAGRSARLFSYGGRVPGPRIEVRPGDEVTLRFSNALPEPTNLHFHGLHVPPTGNADNIFLEIPAGERLTYRFKIPENHPAGTFWYHPHLHGLVAKQVFLGMAGLFVVRGELDRIPEVAAAREQFAVLKDFEVAGGRVPPPSPMEFVRGREGSLVTVNGEVEPEWTVERDGLLRLRLLNASTARFYRLKLEDHPLYLIATDGGALEEPYELDELLLAPGERAEVLVRGEREPGRYTLWALPYNRGNGGMGMGGGMMGGAGGDTRPRPLAHLVYAGRRKTPLPLPERTGRVPELGAPVRRRRFVLGHSMQPGRGMVFTINGQVFNPGRIDTPVRLGTVEEWEIANMGVLDHPFHLHTNPFQIVSRGGRRERLRAWKDTVLVPVRQSVRFRVAFEDFPGNAVYHCHILEHEDLGMMGIVRFEEGA
ncbi:multicopper oxidase type 3 [Oceanithermus profundus DSM 14977]|uniref:Multicopper oxidase type 3 n=1 Tax=Oceanithermus profundus (strain DSM 14977 / NBRC 100410 / VKM B-2274 / 506) TaxID=670487 RepID=E4U705_OCEP5|nr:multicopper oxidase family protein [Oceanithermus profundus]ADR36008.1 multicopper oxidase type 3 [Oceanithermus profundus DSM 14977]